MSKKKHEWTRKGVTASMAVVLAFGMVPAVPGVALATEKAVGSSTPVESTTPVAQENDSTAPAWDGTTIDTSWYTESKSSTTYYISNAEELAGLAAIVNGTAGDEIAADTFAGKTIVLASDIDLGNKEWTPIGNSTNSFAGTFNGNNCTISNLKIDNDDLSCAGLFGRLVTPGSIGGLTISNVAIEAESEVGALVGSAYTGSIDNCLVDGKIAIVGLYKVGGLAGEGYAAISDCNVSGAEGSYVEGKYQGKDLEGDNVGGLIGYMSERSGSSIARCSVDGLSIRGTRKVGGLIGYAFGCNSIEECRVSNSDVESCADENYATANKSSMGIGGLVGIIDYGDKKQYQSGKLKNCIAQDVEVKSTPGVTTGDLVSGLRNRIGDSVNDGAVIPAESWVDSSVDFSFSLDGSQAYSASNIQSAAQLIDAIEHGSAGEEIRLGSDISLSTQLIIGRDLTIDLNGKTINNSFQISNGAEGENRFSLVTKGNIVLKNGNYYSLGGNETRGIGQYSGNLLLDGMTLESSGLNVCDYSSNGKLEIEICTIKGDYAVASFANNADVDIVGSALYGNTCGLYHNGSYYGLNMDVKETVIRGAGDADSQDDSTDDITAVYISGSHSITSDAGRDFQNVQLTNCEIVGATGVEVKYTNLVIDGEKTRVEATESPAEDSLNNNGSVTVGYAVASTHNGTQSADDSSHGSIVIKNGSFVGEVGAQEPVGEDQESGVDISIYGGTFKGISDIDVFRGYVPSGYVVDGNSESGYKVSKEIPSSGGSTGGGSTVPSEPEGEVTENPDGSTTTTVTEEEKNDDGSTTTTVTETTEGREDGSTTEKVTETTVSEDGSKAVKVTETNTLEDGTSATTVVEDGVLASASAKVTREAVEAAGGGAVALPFAEPVEAKASGEAVAIELEAPAKARIAVPVAKAEGAEAVAPGAVLVLVDAEGGVTVLPKTANTGEALSAEVPGDCTLKVVDASADFPDVSDDAWYAKQGVDDFISARGVMTGVEVAPGSFEFQGDKETDRGMFVTMLHRLESEPAVDSEGFADVAEGSWYAESSEWAVEAGIATGYENADGTFTFDGDGNVTREQMATFLFRYANWLGLDTSARADREIEGVSDFAEDAMSWAVAEGLIQGDDDTGAIRPGDGATRAEAAVVVMRMIDLMA